METTAERRARITRGMMAKVRLISAQRGSLQLPTASQRAVDLARVAEAGLTIQPANVPTENA